MAAKTEIIDILPDDVLWHWVPQNQIQLDPLTGDHRPTSNAFRRGDKKPVSAELSKLTTLEETQRRSQGKPIVAITVQSLHEIGCGAKHDPLPDNPAHTLIYGNHEEYGPSHSQSRKIASKAEFITDTEGNYP